MVLQCAGGAPLDLGRDVGGGSEFRAHPMLAFDIEDRRQPADAVTGVNADVRVERDRDVGGFVNLESLGHGLWKITAAPKRRDSANGENIDSSARRRSRNLRSGSCRVRPSARS